MGQIDSGGEQPPAAIFRVFDHIAAQNGDVDCWVEGGDIDRNFETVERRFIFGVEITRITHRNVRRLAAPFERSARELEFSTLVKSAAVFRRFGPRQ
jgi:hypothetical protein